MTITEFLRTSGAWIAWAPVTTGRVVATIVLLLLGVVLPGAAIIWALFRDGDR
jgi:hypothetical protein